MTPRIVVFFMAGIISLPIVNHPYTKDEADPSLQDYYQLLNEQESMIDSHISPRYDSHFNISPDANRMNCHSNGNSLESMTHDAVRFQLLSLPGDLKMEYAKRNLFIQPQFVFNDDVQPNEKITTAFLNQCRCYILVV